MTEKTDRWYQSAWVWFIIGLLVITVTACLYTVKLSMDLPPDLLPVQMDKFALESNKAASTGSEVQFIESTP